MPLKSKSKLKTKPNKAFKKLKQLSKATTTSGGVKVGLPKNSNAYPDGTSVILVGLVQEFGSAMQNIPERSFLRATILENRSKYKSAMKKLAKKIVDGKIDTTQALQILGLMVEADVKGKITDIKDPPLTSRSGNPLILTGHLRQSITHQVDI